MDVGLDEACWWWICWGGDEGGRGDVLLFPNLAGSELAPATAKRGHEKKVLRACVAAGASIVLSS